MLIPAPTFLLLGVAWSCMNTSCSPIIPPPHAPELNFPGERDTNLMIEVLHCPSCGGPLDYDEHTESETVRSSRPASPSLPSER